MSTTRSFRSLVAVTAALALTATAGLAVFAQAEDAGKHFSVVEAASDADALSVTQIAQKNRTSVVAIETETHVVYNDSDSYYNPFSMFGYGYPFGGRGGTKEYTQTSAGSGIIISADVRGYAGGHLREPRHRRDQDRRRNPDACHIRRQRSA